MPITNNILRNILIVALSLLAVLILYSALKSVELIALVLLLVSLIFILL